MALKLKIKKVAFDVLPDVIKAEYKVNQADADEYLLDAEGMEDTGALKRAKDREAEARRVAEEELTKAKAKITELDAALGGDALERARKAGDIATLEKSWQTQKEAAVGEVTKKLTSREAFIQSQLVDSVAHALAAKTSTAPAVMVPHIKARLQADLSGDVPVTRVLDKDGKVSALSLDDLQKEFVANPDFASIIIASNGSGGGAPGGKQGGGGAVKKFAEMTGAERIEFNKRDPAGFAKESAAATAGSVRI